MSKFTYIILTMMLFFLACGTTKYVTVESVRTDSIYKHLVSVDTVLQRDSVFIEHKGDTVRELRYKTVYKVKQIKDTTVVEKIDSVPVPYPEIQYVEKTLSKWESFKQDVGGMAIGIIGIAAVAAAVWIVRKWRKG